MATLTASVSGLASVAATWGGGGTPADGDTLGCNVGVEVEWDLNVPTATTGFIFTGWNGTLKFCRTAGSYGFKIKTNTTMAGSGIMDSGADYPTGCQFTITYASGAKCSLNQSVLDCALPTNPYCLLKGEHAAGASKIYVMDTAGADLDITADAEWKNGYYVRVDNNASTPASEEFTISGTGNDAGGYYVTLSGTLAATKVLGSRITLCSRNIHLNGSTSGSTAAFDNVYGSTLRCAIRGFAYATNNFWGNTCDLAVSGCTIGVYTSSGCFFEALHLTGCTTATYFLGRCQIENLSISGATSGAYKSSGWDVLYGLFDGNQYHIRRCTDMRLRSCYFAAGTKWASQTITDMPAWAYLESENDGWVTGAYDARTAGGTVTRATGSGDYTATCDDADNWAFRQTRFTLMPGEVRRLQCTMSRSPGGPDAMIEIIQADEDPLVDSTYTARATQALVDDDEDLDIDWANPYTYPVDVFLRISAKAASGTVDFSETITAAPTLCPDDIIVECYVSPLEDPTLQPDDIVVVCALTDDVASDITISPDSLYSACSVSSPEQVLCPDSIYCECAVSELEHTTMQPDDIIVECVLSDDVAMNTTISPDSIHCDCIVDAVTIEKVLQPDNITVICLIGQSDQVLRPDSIYCATEVSTIPILLTPDNIVVSLALSSPIPVLQPDNIACITSLTDSVKSEITISPDNIACLTSLPSNVPSEITISPDSIHCDTYVKGLT